MRLKKLENENNLTKNSHQNLLIGLGITALYVFAGSLFFLKPHNRRPSGKKIDIEIRYNTEKDADATLLAQNIVKIIRMVLMPLESKIKKESAQLIFVYSDESWEMRVRNGSEKLRRSVSKLLEAKEW
jgi:hypothetical protein